jgi:OmpA-OmpF porin, OOP family
MSQVLFRSASLAAIVATAMFAGVPQAAAADAGRFYIVPGLQWMDFDSQRKVDDKTGYSFGAGYGLTEKISAELTYTRINSMTTTNLAGRDRLRALRLDVLYNLDNSVGAFSPFFVAGLGDSRFDSNKDTTLNVGAGLKYRFNDRIEWRASARTFYGIDDRTFDVGLDTALVFRLGAAPAPARVEPSPMPVAVADSDGDGVPDDRDACPNTPRNYAVDERGCPILIEELARIELAVQFDFDRSEVKPQYFDDIRRIAEFLNQHSDVVAQLEGHTCNMGSDDYNQGLSERRANAVRQVLIERFGVSPTRVSATGYGEARPITSNATQQGRERNRRVESAISTTVQRPQTRN